VLVLEFDELEELLICLFIPLAWGVGEEDELLLFLCVGENEFTGKDVRLEVGGGGFFPPNHVFPISESWSMFEGGELGIGRGFQVKKR